MFDPSKLNLDEEETTTSQLHDDSTIPQDDSTNDPLASVEADTDKQEDILETTEVYSPKKHSEAASETSYDSKTPDLYIPETQEVVYDVNIKSLKDIVHLLLLNKYDFVTFEPDNEKATITFRKDGAIAETKYISYPIFSNILLKAKSATNLNLGETQTEQEGKAQIILENKNYDIITKTVPSKTGEKLFFKTKLSSNQEKAKKAQKKSNLGQMLAFLGSVLVILLILGGGFLSFVVINAKTVEDVRFFESLGINLNEINNFIGIIVTVIFLTIIFFEVIGLVLSLFRFLLTKKNFRQRKIKFGILAAILFIITFSTASAWMFIDRKVQDLPEWATLARGEVQVYDNAKLISDKFDIPGAFIEDTSSLIGPVQLKFDVSNLQRKEEKKGFTIKKYIWKFNDEEIITTEPELIKTFDEKGIVNISLTLEEADSASVVTEKLVENLPSLNISYMVDISYKPVASGGSYVTLNAKDLSVLGKAEWYDLGNLDTPLFTGEQYITARPIVTETLIGLYMSSASREDKMLDQIFILEGEEEKDLDAEITTIKSKTNDLEWTFSAKDILVDNGAGGIDTFKWTIEGQTYTKEANIAKLEISSMVKHTFKEYGEHTITLEITDIAGNSKTITKMIDAKKSLSLENKLQIYSDKTLLTDITYNENLHEYYVNDLAVPTILNFDARYVRAANPSYSLQKISWDYNNDGDIDSTGKQESLKIFSEGSKSVKVIYEFVHKRNEKQVITLEEMIFIESIQKEAVIDFKIEKSSEYVPTKVKLDASKARVKGQNIAKFKWDYGDGIVEERDSIVDGHYYRQAGNYDIFLTITTEEGQEYTTSKKLILKPTPQEAKIVVSMKNTKIRTEIDFSSSDSTGDIIGYFWDFGDGNTSSKANPSHMYTKPGIYTVKLRLDYRNNNFKETTEKITISR